MRRTLLDIDFLDAQNPDHILRTFRRIFGRAGLNDREVRILHGLFSKIDWIEGRITSYNVCYTKLLRTGRLSHAQGIAGAAGGRNGSAGS